MSGMGDMFDPTGLRSAAEQLDVLARAAAKAGREQTKPLPQMRGKTFDGVLYIRADDLADALESQAPKTNERLITKLRAAARRT